MSLRWMDDRAAVVAAEEALLHTRTLQREQTRWLRVRLQRHRVGMIVAGGIGAGMLVGWLPVRSWLRTGAAAVSTGFALARTPIGPLLFGALFARHSSPAEPPADAQDA